MLVAKVVLVEWMAALFLARNLLFGFVRCEVFHVAAMLTAHDAHHALPRGAPLVESNPDASVAIALALGATVRGDFAQGTPFQVGQFEILEHDLDQLFERYIGLVIIDARPITCLTFALTLAVLTGLADHLARTHVAVALADAARVIPIDEPVFLDSAQRNLDYPILIFPDNRFFGDDVGDILAN